MNIIEPILLLLFVTHFSSTFCSRILFVPAHDAASHAKSLYPFAESLAAEGHDIFVLQLVRGSHGKAKNNKINDLYIELEDEQGEQVVDPKMLWGTILNHPIAYIFPWYATSTVCRDVLNDPKLRSEYLKVMTQKWDLILVDQIFASCGLLSRNLNNATLADISTSLVVATAFVEKGCPWNFAYMPAFRPEVKFDVKKFFTRLWNAFDGFIFWRIVDSMEYLLPYWLNSSISSEISTKGFHSDAILSFGVFPYELDFIHCKSANIIEMDSSCPTSSRQLAEPYLSFVEDVNSKGTILFAMGHYAGWDYAPPSALKAFVDAFDKLTEYRIIWQYVSKGATPTVGRHVMFGEWIPQFEILNHNKTVLFISHCGLKSFREAICAQTPIVALPMFAEQLRNGAIVENKRIGEVLNKLTLTTENILTTLKLVLSDSSYKTNIVKMNQSLTDRIDHPLNVGSFWVDFILKHPEADVYLRHKLHSTFARSLESIVGIFITVISLTVFLLY